MAILCGSPAEIGMPGPGRRAADIHTIHESTMANGRIAMRPYGGTSCRIKRMLTVNMNAYGLLGHGVGLGITAAFCPQSRVNLAHSRVVVLIYCVATDAAHLPTSTGI